MIFTSISIQILIFIGCASCATNKFSRNTIRVSNSVIVRTETEDFMQYALAKMGAMNCMTFIHDGTLDADLIEFLDGCPVSLPSCSSYKYLVFFEGSNDTMSDATLSAGAHRQCGGYIIIMTRKERILQLLHYGDNFNLINTRARFLIWYKGNDKSFERNSIWTKIINVIFFHSNIRRRSISNGIIFTIRELIWPVNIDSKQIRVRVIEFWGQYQKHFIYNKNQPWFRDKTNDLKNVTLRILVVEHPPGVIKFKDNDGQAQWGGTEIEILKALSMSLNFNFIMTEVDLDTSNNEFINNYPKLWANILDNGHIIEESEHKKLLPNDTRSYFAAGSKLITGDGADLAVGSFYILKEYLEYLDMSIPLDVACTSFLTPIPLSKPKYLVLILPFQYQLWLLVIAICFIFGPLILRLLSSAIPKYKDEFYLFSNPLDTIFTSFSLMSQVPPKTWPKHWPLRWFLTWYWLFWICLTLAYRASMVSFLTIPLTENPLDNLHDLEQSNLRIGGWGIELYQLFTKTYSENDTKADRKKLVSKYEVIKDVDEAISMVASRKFALYENLRSLQFIKMTKSLSSNGSPRTHIMKQCVVPVHIGFAYQKHSALTHTINRKVRRFQESGLLHKWRKELVLKKKDFNIENVEIFDSEAVDSETESQQNQQQKVLGVQDLQGCFYFLLIGLIVSILVFFGEVLLRIWKVTKSKIHKKTGGINGQDRLKTNLLNFKLVLLVNHEIYKEFTKMGEKKRRTCSQSKKRSCILKRKPSIPPFPYIE